MAWLYSLLLTVSICYCCNFTLHIHSFLLLFCCFVANIVVVLLDEYPSSFHHGISEGCTISQNFVGILSYDTANKFLYHDCLQLCGSFLLYILVQHTHCLFTLDARDFVHLFFVLFWLFLTIITSMC